MDRDDIEATYGKGKGKITPMARLDNNRPSFALTHQGKLKVKKPKAKKSVTSVGPNKKSIVYTPPTNLARQATPAEREAMYGKLDETVGITGQVNETAKINGHTSKLRSTVEIDVKAFGFTPR